MQNKQGKKVPPRAAGRNATPQQVRIIGGQWKRTPLAVADAEGLRPTPDRVRETLFNWLTHLLDGHWQDVACLDLFAGTGAMGFEAASRGAAQVTLVESHPVALRQMQLSREKLRAQQIEIVRGDALSVARTLTERQDQRFDLIFLDPPYQQNWLPKVLPICELLLKTGGMVYAEAEFPLTDEPEPDWLAQWDIIRADQAGVVYYHVLQRKQIQA
jgi:16S rRNA (guanine966-N2)-methyltransferase